MMQDLESEGVHVMWGGKRLRKLKVILMCGVLDAPARSAAQQFAQFSSTNGSDGGGCGYCHAPVERIVSCNTT